MQATMGGNLINYPDDVGTPLWTSSLSKSSLTVSSTPMGQDLPILIYPISTS